MFLPEWRSGQLTREAHVNPTGGPNHGGLLAEYLILNQNAAVRPPRSLGNEHAATLPIAAITA